MIKNFFSSLRRFPASSLLNILGMALAFASAYFILVQVYYDFNYNRAIPNADRICRIEMASWFNDGKYSCYLNHRVPQYLIDNTPQAEAGCHIYLGTGTSHWTIERNEALIRFDMRNTIGTKEMFDVFDFDILSGNIADFEATKTIIIAESIAKKFDIKVGDVMYYGSKVDPEQAASVVGIFRDFPRGTDLGNIEAVAKTTRNLSDDGEWSYPHYMKVMAGTDMEALNEQLSELAYKFFSGNEDIANLEHEEGRRRTRIRLVPLSESYFDNMSDEVDGLTGNRTTSVTLLCIAILIITIAFINFVNFFFALVPIRIRGVNTRKIFGASQARLNFDLVCESIGLVVMSLAVGACIVILAGDTTLASYLSTSMKFADNLPVVTILLVAALGVGVLTSLYPAWYITSFPPAMVVKGSFSASASGKALRYTLVGVQFVISIAMIISATFVKLQHDYMMNYDMGFNREALLTTNVTPRVGYNLSVRESFDAKLKENPQIIDVAWAAGDIVNTTRMGWGRMFKGDQINFQCYPVSWNFLQFMGIDLVEGRDFTSSDERSNNGVFIFNEAAQKQFSLTLEDKLEGYNGDAPIAGFCRDFNFKPLQYGVAPFAFFIFGDNPWWRPQHCYIRTSAGADYKAVIKYIEQTVSEIDPAMRRDQIKVSFFDEELGRQYAQEHKLTILVTIFSFISIVISLMGVFGLVLFETQYRRKEIGVRRVFGSSVGEILRMFNRRFITIVLICFAVACPLAYFIMERWFAGFAYHVPMFWWVYLLAFAIVLAITVTTVTLRSLRAATENPINSIKTE